MSRNVADFIWERLLAWGVRRVYGYPGDGIGGLIGALSQRAGRDRICAGSPRRDGGLDGLR